MKKSTLFTLAIIAIPIGLLLLAFWLGGMFKLILQVAGPLGIVGLFAFIAFILTSIFIGMKLARNAVKPKTLANGLPATATVIRSYQGALKISFGGVQQNYQLIIEINVTNPQGETWPAKMTEMVPLTQVGVFQPGVSFKVLYDPNDRSKVVFDQSQQAQQQPFSNSVDIPGYGTVNSEMARQALQNQPQDIALALQSYKALLESLRGTGVSATATVLSRETIQENFMPGIDIVKLRFRVDKNGYETEELVATRKTSLYKCEAGKTVYVLHAPDNPKRVSISGLDKPDGVIEL